ncbi:class I adenylate-forming enzyme family protein [Mycobacterium paraseoulense]|uniref:Acyl-CoA synthetase n=1 Tax=Mycobacterium paraseoulense TaxID=590652 RepID=A0A1X0IHB8_9MYCO|nr:class I adenylate-forming enzyme family protein [Mycobacterium paraseoulense]MCV7395376.1 acyl--CoA ligase [Mycobacterium paraseoulense]ORB46400.1 acyl-CoA synthetase [Mycobacterium paraseoulense]BBZ71767.1 AMP-binding protein [Mycobacterium paraseoulense]
MSEAPRTFAYEPMPYAPVVPAMLVDLVAAYGDNDFVISTAGGGTIERITYAQAAARSAEMARRLLAAGVIKGVRVGILAPNGPDFAVAFLAATRIGAVAVPINTFFQPPELSWLLRDADIHTLLSVDSLLGKDMLARVGNATGELPPPGAPLGLERLPQLRNIFGLGDSERTWPSAWPEPAPETFLRACESTVRPSDDLVVIYTSGSTSDPKGIIHTHGTVITHSRFVATQHEWKPDDRVYIPMVFFWVAGLVFGLLGPMQTGATILTEHKFDAGDVLRLLETERATYATGFPHVGRALANHPDFTSADLSSLRGGYHQVLLPPELRAADPSLLVTQLGMTETCSSHTWWPPHEPVPESKRGSLGVAAPGYEHKVVDECGAEVPNGTIGEICVRGVAMMRGMIGRQHSDLFDADGWYHTKDAGYLDDEGFLFFTGRTDDMIKSSGANVAPVEVEAVIGGVDGVRIAYVVGVPDADKGALVCAVVVLNQGRCASQDELAAACRRELAAYKVPKRWVILPDADRLPYTTTNKIDKPRLVQLVTSGELA